MRIKSIKRKNFKALRKLGFSYSDALYLNKYLGKLFVYFPKEIGVSIVKIQHHWDDDLQLWISDKILYSFKGIQFTINNYSLLVS